jgi:hypothetical protein
MTSAPSPGEVTEIVSPERSIAAAPAARASDSHMHRVTDARRTARRVSTIFRFECVIWPSSVAAAEAPGIGASWSWLSAGA